jgi:hypothetical protein
METPTDVDRLRAQLAEIVARDRVDEGAPAEAFRPAWKISNATDRRSSARCA